MPRNTTINRRNIGSILNKRTLAASDVAVKDISLVAERLKVSQGSLIDTALKMLTGLPDLEILALLKEHDHLTQLEYDFILDQLDNPDPKAKNGSGISKKK